MNNKEINELFHRVKNRLVAQVIPTWENLAPMQAQTPMTQQDYNFGGVNSFNSSCYVSQLKSTYRATIIRVGGHMTIFPMNTQVCRFKTVQVPTFKNKSYNRQRRSCFLL